MTIARLITAATAALVALLPAAEPSAPPVGLYCSVDVRAPSDITCTDEPVDPEPVDPAAVAARAAAPSAAAASVLIGRLYDNANYDSGAGYLDVYAPSDCTATTADLDFQLSNLGVWNARVTSFRSYGSCSTRLWSGLGYTGSAYPSSTSFLVSSTNVGAAFNDSARSVQFS